MAKPAIRAMLNRAFTWLESLLPKARAESVTAPVSKMPAQPEKSMSSGVDIPMAPTASAPMVWPAMTLSIIIPKVAESVMRIDMLK